LFTGLKKIVVIKDWRLKMPIGIEDIEYVLPSQNINSEELAAKFGFSLSFIEEKIGVRQLYSVGKNEKTSDLAAKASRKILDKFTGIENKIGVVVVCTQTPDFQLPHTSAIVQYKLGLDKSVACFDIGLGCSGFVYGLSVVKSFMEENNLEYGLLVTAETYSTIINDNDKHTRPLFSDSAAATLVGRNPSLIPQLFTFGTDGSRYDHLILRTSNKTESGRDNGYLYMNGRGIFEFAAVEITKDVENCLSRNNVKKDDIKFFVFHQASKFLLTTLSRKLGLDQEGKVVICMEKFGNTVSSSIPMALSTIYNFQNKTQCKILISGFGVGLSWASTILISNGEKGNG